jgi:catechol 2,3-dioxygenase-like lactoylglutathione lyase family enzyme
MDWKLELVIIPVSDADRAKQFYVEKLGFNADHDNQVNPQLRFIQLTPPGSACSIALGQGLTDATPGSEQGLLVVVQDVEDARRQLLSRGVEASEVQTFDWGSYVYLNDPDGNRWTLQQLPNRG